MNARYTLGIIDYLVILFFLLVSAGIGVIFRRSGGKHQTMLEYLMAGKNMPLFPVILSTTSTMTATGTMLSTPAEIYRYGIQSLVQPFATAIGMYLAVYVFVPVYFQCGVTTIYEFLEIRFGKYTRYAASCGFLLQALVAMSPLLYGPSLALSAVTDLSLKTSIIVIGGVCTFYCAMGGLKAVLWTDVMQTFLMFVFVTAFYIAGLSDVGGISTIYERAKIGHRLEIFNLSFDLTVRYTFWNCLLKGFIYGFGSYGTSQLEVQRLLCLKDSKRAQRSLLYSIFPVFIFHSLSNLAGLVLYSIYYLCDPVRNKAETGLTKYDQMMPYYIVRKFSAYPGLTGLCIAGIFSGSLSTISSVLNCLTTVTVVDYIKPFFLNFTEKKNLILAKGFSVLYGLMGVGLAFAFSYVQSLKQFGVTISVLNGSLVGVFLIGILTRKADDKCVVLGMIFSYPIIIWIAMGTLISGYIQSPLELGNCSVSQDPNWNNFPQSLLYSNISNLNATCSSPIQLKDTFIVYKISYLWLPILSASCTGLMILFMVFVTGWNKNAIAEDSRCLSPVTRFWKKKTIVRSTFLLPVDNIKSQTSTVNGEEVSETVYGDKPS